MSVMSFYVTAMLFSWSNDLSQSQMTCSAWGVHLRTGCQLTVDELTRPDLRLAAAPARLHGL
jgi:hypothetical protein